jgi:hypothetical protein
MPVLSDDAVTPRTQLGSPAQLVDHVAGEGVEVSLRQFDAAALSGKAQRRR